MRSRLLYTTEEGYTAPLDTAVLFDGGSVQAYGRGTGKVDWSGKSGVVEWTNFPSRRPDGVFLLDITGSIHLEDGDRPVLFRMEGTSLPPDPDGYRLIAATVRWFTEEESLVWLNDRLGFCEGQIAVETGRIRTAVFVLDADPPD